MKKEKLILVDGVKITEEHLVYLDTLRESRKTNMCGAGIYIENKFGVSRKTARIILSYWMKTFEERHKD